MNFLRTLLLLSLPALAIAGGPTERADDAGVYIVSPQHGARVTSPVRVVFGLQGMGIAPAGTDAANTGHHHLLVDVDSLPALDQPLPATDQVIHFGKGQTETVLELSPGQHTLRLLLGDHLHRPHSEPVMSEEITVIVE